MLHENQRGPSGKQRSFRHPCGQYKGRKLCLNDIRPPLPGCPKRSSPQLRIEKRIIEADLVSWHPDPFEHSASLTFPEWNPAKPRGVAGLMDFAMREHMILGVLAHEPDVVAQPR